MATKVGLIGAGGMTRYHVAGFRRAGADVVTIADVRLEAARKAAEANAIDSVYGDVTEMLAGADVDAVSIIVPNRFHAPLAIQALEAGKHVFCEKPPALNATEVQEMIDAADRAGRLLLFNFNNRARPESFAMKGFVDDGTVGHINSAQARWIRRTGIPGFGGWFTNRELSGGGALIDLLHMVDLALHLMGSPEPEWVLGQTFDEFATDSTFKGPWGVPDVAGGTTDVETAAHGFVRFRTGQVLSLQVSWAEMVEREEVSVNFQGTRAGGRIRRLFGKDGLDETAIDSCELYTHQGGRALNASVAVDACEDMGRIRSAQNFVLAIEGREEPLNTPEQALSLMKIIDAVYESARTGRPVAC